MIAQVRLASVFALAVMAAAAFLFVRPWTSHFEDIHIPLTQLNPGTTSLGLSETGGSWRFAGVEVRAHLSPRQSRPVSMELRGGGPKGMILARKFIFHPDAEPGETTVVLSGFTWWNESLCLVIATAGDPGEAVDVGVTAWDWLSRGVRVRSNPAGQDGRIYLFSLHAFGLVLAGFALAGLLPPLLHRNRGAAAWLYGDRLKGVGIALLGCIVLISAVTAYFLVRDVFAPLDHTWTPQGWSPDAMMIGKADLFLDQGVPPLDIYVPGTYFFYAAILGALRCFDVARDSLLYTEIGWRVVQFLLASLSAATLYFSIAGHLRRASCPGAWIFPLIAPWFMLCNLEMLIPILQPGPFALVPALIAWLFAAALESMRRNSIAVDARLGAALAAVMLWRNDFVLLGMMTLALLLLLDRFSRRGWRRCLRACLVMALPFCLLMGYYALTRGSPRIYEVSHEGVTGPETLFVGRPDNPYGYILNDTVMIHFAYVLDPSPHPDNPSALKAFRDRFLLDLARHPDLAFSAWANRAGLNVFFERADNETSGQVLEALKKYRDPASSNDVFLLMLAGLCLGGLALGAWPRLFALAALPAVYGLGIIGFFAFGLGYFYYTRLSFVILIALGLPLALSPTRGPAGDKGRLESLAAWAMAAVLAAVFWFAASGYDFAKAHYTQITERVSQEQLRRLLASAEKPGSPRIVWGVSHRGWFVPEAAGGLFYHRGKVLVTSHDALLAVDAADGRIIKTLPLDRSATWAFSVLEGETLFVLGHDWSYRAHLFALDLEALTLAKAGDLPVFPAWRPQVRQGRLYGSVYAEPYPRSVAMAAQSPGGEKPGWISRFRSFAAPVLDEANLYCGGMDAGEFAAVEAASGRELWRFSGRGNVFGQPVLEGGSVYYVDNAGTAWRLDLENGGLQARLDSGRAYFDGLAVRDGVAYFGTFDFSIVAADLTGPGSLRWEKPGRGASLSSPLIRGGAVIVPSGTWLISLDAATGRVLWEMDLGSFARELVFAGQDRLIVRCQDYVLALDLLPEDPARPAAALDNFSH